MLGNSNLRTVKSLPFGKIGQFTVVFTFRLFFQRETENVVNFPPAFGKDALALAVKEWPPQSKVAVTASYS